MGVAVSHWHLARQVARSGGLGVVSGTALDAVLARRLQDGDPGGDMRRAMDAFPVPEVAERVWEKYYLEGGRPEGTGYRPMTDLSLRPNRAVNELAVVGNFVEVWLAKEGHAGLVGINCLEKVQMATPAAILGAMLADVDYVLMGAGIPREIPRLLDDYAAGRPGTISVDVAGGDARPLTIDPRELLGREVPVRRPLFLAIISAEVLAGYLSRDESTRPDGFVVEGPVAGGHNAPPRGRLSLDEQGDPVYGPRDIANLAKIADMGLPFWVAGGAGTPEGVAAALEAGATGVQVGTVFALSHDSGIDPPLRARMLDELRAGTLVVRTEHRGSPTGFPFKVAQIEGTMSSEDVYADRPRLCNLGYLRVPFEKADGAVGYRCPAEPENTWERKGGEAESTEGRKCLCNGLLSAVGLPQHRKDGYVEPPLLTLGSDLQGARRLIELHPDGWRAHQVVEWLTA
ncbi:MAG: nitronate monooxygenase [Micrococcales bacterium]|nr:nitronate monooxygenase [Micrococcales bacterium]